MLSHKLCSPITCSCQITTNIPVILKILGCDITSSSQCSPPLRRNLMASCTINRQHHIQWHHCCFKTICSWFTFLPQILLFCHYTWHWWDNIQGQCPSQLSSVQFYLPISQPNTYSLWQCSTTNLKAVISQKYKTKGYKKKRKEVTRRWRKLQNE